MTTNQLIACALGKDCCFTGQYGDATPFTENSRNASDKIVENMSSEMKKYGFSPYGWETMYNGMTGERINAKIFIGPTYYQRLKHMVDDKLHARANGRKTGLTRQPSAGRSEDGGKLMPQWYLIVLLVRITTGNINKDRETLATLTGYILRF